MAKRKKKIPKTPRSYCGHQSRHHLCWQGRAYAGLHAKRLREMFVETINIDLHRHIHENLNHIPVPPENLCLEAIKKYQGGVGLLTNIVWLAENIPYSPFQQAMLRQLQITLNYKPLE